MQIIREIAKKVAQIQNAGLGEFRIRDLNDEINKLLREKRHWEVQIKELGGPDYSRVGPRMLDHEGREVKYQEYDFYNLQDILSLLYVYISIVGGKNYGINLLLIFKIIEHVFFYPISLTNNGGSILR